MLAHEAINDYLLPGLRLRVWGRVVCFQFAKKE